MVDDIFTRAGIDKTLQTIILSIASSDPDFKTDTPPYVKDTTYRESYAPIKRYIEKHIATANTTATGEVIGIDKAKLGIDEYALGEAEFDALIEVRSALASIIERWQTKRDNRKTLVQLQSDRELFADKLYPANIFEVAGQKLGQTLAAERAYQDFLPMQQAYFAAIFESNCSGIVNMYDHQKLRSDGTLHTDRPFQCLKPGEKVTFRDKNGNIVTVIPSPNKRALIKSLEVGEDKIDLYKDEYTITYQSGNQTTTKTIQYVGFDGFGDDDNPSEALKQAKNELMASAIEQLDQNHGLDGRVMSNCSQGQNRSNFANFSIAYRKLLNDQIDAIIAEHPDNIEAQRAAITELKTFLNSEAAPGYTQNDLLAESLRATIETQVMPSSKQRGQVLSFAEYTANKIVEQRLERLTAVTHAHDEYKGTVIDAPFDLSGIRADSNKIPPHPPAAGGPSPTPPASPRPDSPEPATSSVWRMIREFGKAIYGDTKPPSTPRAGGGHSPRQKD